MLARVWRYYKIHFLLYKFASNTLLAHLCTKVTPRLHLTLHVFKREGFVVMFKMINNIALFLYFLFVVCWGFSFQ